MTKFDIKNYFQSIYNINVALVNTRIQQGVFVVVVVIVVYLSLCMWCNGYHGNLISLVITADYTYVTVSV